MIFTEKRQKLARVMALTRMALTSKEKRREWARAMVRKISMEKRRKLGVVGLTLFRVIFTYYRLSRKLLMNTYDFIHRSGSKLIKHLSSVRRQLKLQQYYCKSEEKEEADEDRWSKQLPGDILQMVLPRLCVPDVLRCCGVCRSWRSAAVNYIEIAKASSNPWLLIHSHPFWVKEDCFVSLTEDKIYKSNPTYHLDRLTCVGSTEGGWLVMVDTATRRPEGFMKPWSFYLHDPNAYTSINFFLNPISGAKIMLPSQSTIPCRWRNSDNFLQKVVASSSPTTPHCLVASLCFGQRLAFCSPADKSWTLIEDEDEDDGIFYTTISDIEVIDGKLYVLTEKAPEILIIYHIQLDVNGGGRHTYRTERLAMLDPCPETWINKTERDGLIYFDKTDIHLFLFKDSISKELFMVFVRMSVSIDADDYFDPIIPPALGGSPFAIPPQMEGFRVFKLESSNGGSRWVEVVNLGGRILFLSCDTKLFIPAGPNEKRNCIYFAFHVPCVASSVYIFGEFSFTNGRIERRTFLKDPTPARLWSQPIWFTPTL